MKRPKSSLRDDWSRSERMWGPTGKPETRRERMKLGARGVRLVTTQRREDRWTQT